MGNTTVFPTERLIEASTDAAYARRLVRWLRASALSGGRFDSDVFDAAVLAQRRTERAALGSLRAWAQSRRRATTQPGRSDHLFEQRAA
jgi:hypothetical protein